MNTPKLSLDVQNREDSTAQFQEIDRNAHFGPKMALFDPKTGQIGPSKNFLAKSENGISSALVSYNILPKIGKKQWTDSEISDFKTE